MILRHFIFCRQQPLPNRCQFLNKFACNPHKHWVLEAHFITRTRSENNGRTKCRPLTALVSTLSSSLASLLDKMNERLNIPFMNVHLFRKFRAPKSDISEHVFPPQSAIPYNESMHMKMCKFITGSR